MKEFITGQVVANSIRMKRSGYQGSFLIVEGPDDSVEETIEFFFMKKIEQQNLKIKSSRNFEERDGADGAD